MANRKGQPLEKLPEGDVVLFFEVHVFRFIDLSVFGSRNQAKDHGLRTVQRTAYPT